MRLCIPTEDDRGLESELHGHFGTARYFTLIDPDRGDLEIVPNPDCHQDQSSCPHTALLAHHRVDTVACAGIGRRAFAALHDAGIEVLALQQRTVSEIVSTAAEHRLSPLTSEKACCGGRGSGSGHGEQQQRRNCHG